MFETLKNFPFDIKEHNPTKTWIRFGHTEEIKKAISESKMGIKQSPEHIKNRILSTTGFKQSDYQKKVSAETLSTEWIITNPLGQSYKIKNLRKFCRDNGLDQGNLSRGSYKGWKAVKLEA